MILSMIVFLIIEGIVLGIIITAYLKAHRFEPNSVKALVLKGLPTFLAFLIACFGLLKKPDLYAVFILSALLLGTAADVLIERSLIWGGCFFVFGHICYLLAFVFGCDGQVFSRVAFGAAFVVAAIISVRYHEKLSLSPVCIGIILYGILLCVLFSVTVPVVLSSIPFAVRLAGLGILIFILSDLLLFRNTVLNKKRYLDHYISLSVYYTAQLIIAISICIR